MGEKTQTVLVADRAQWVSVHQRHEGYGMPARPERVIDQEPFDCRSGGALNPELATSLGEFPGHSWEFGIFGHSALELALPPNLGCGPKCSRMTGSGVKSGLTRMALTTDAFADIQRIGRIDRGLRA